MTQETTHPQAGPAVPGEVGRPESTADGDDPRSRFDTLLSRCPVATGVDGTHMILGHAEVVAAATDPATFSSDVSRFLQLPNGLDGDEHARYRALIEPYLTDAVVADLEPTCEGIASRLVADLSRGLSTEIVGEYGARFAVRAACAWLGWPADAEPTLLSWMADNHAATRSGDDARTADVARRFDDLIRGFLATASPHSVPARLAAETVGGRRLAEEQTVSILRNWTAGDLGSLALCVGVIVHTLARRPGIQSELRELTESLPDPQARAALDRGLDEILRIDDPFLANRRVTTRPVTVGGTDLAAGARVVLAWTAANRDPAVVGDPDAYQPEHHARHNLVYGIGPHVCPGRALATMELRTAVVALLRGTRTITLAPDGARVRSHAPAGGWDRLDVVLG